MCSSDLAPQRARRPRDEAYWNETADLVLTYFELVAGTVYCDELLDGFIGWLKHSPGARKQYEEGDDILGGHLKTGH